MTHLGYILKTLRPHRRRLIIALGAMFGIMFIDLGSPLVVAFLIDTVVRQNRYDLLVPLMLVFLMLPFGAAIFRFLSGYLMTLLGQRVVFDIRLDLYRRVHRLHCRFMQNTTTGKVMERLRGDVLQLQTLLTDQAPTVVVQVITGLIMLVIMFVISARLTGVVLGGLVLYIVNYKWMVPRIRKVQRRYRRKMDNLSGMAQERLAGAIVVKSFGRERDESRDFVRKNFAAERVFHRYRMLSLNYSIISSGITAVTYSLVILLGSLFAVWGDITFGALTAMIAFSFRLLVPAAMLAEMSSQIQQGRVALDRIFELMEAKSDVIDQPGTKLVDLRGQVNFENVCFEYEPGKPVLYNLNLSVKPGQTVALVGQTGCGKTTIANLLYRYYEVGSGRLLVDGQDVSDFDTRWYRRQLAMVPQEPIVFDATIAENIRYGRQKATSKQIDQAVRMVELAGLIDRLEEGIETSVGGGGTGLSVGEKQRLCIARAILSDPAILILDEATSSLDTHNEVMVQLAMRRVMANRTCFVIAHRLSTIVNADLIVVLDEGRVVEMGNHAQLMAKADGRYRRLYLTQTAALPKAKIV